jgi:hypothetical protein
VIAGKTVVDIDGRWQVVHFVAGRESNLERVGIQRKTEASGNDLRYTRSFEVKEVTVPVSKAEELKKLYRVIASDSGTRRS